MVTKTPIQAEETEYTNQLKILSLEIDTLIYEINNLNDVDRVVNLTRLLKLGENIVDRVKKDRSEPVNTLFNSQEPSGSTVKIDISGELERLVITSFTKIDNASAQLIKRAEDDYENTINALKTVQVARQKRDNQVEIIKKQAQRVFNYYTVTIKS